MVFDEFVYNWIHMATAVEQTGRYTAIAGSVGIAKNKEFGKEVLVYICI